MSRLNISSARSAKSILPKGIYRRERELKNGKVGVVYQVKIRLQGFPPASGIFERLSDAQRWQHDTISAIRDHKYFPRAEGEKHTLADAIDRYIQDVLPGKPASAEDQRGQLNWWKSELGALRLCDVTPPVLVQARDKLANGKTRFGRPPSASTVTYYLRTISHLFSVAMREWQWIDSNPLRRVSLPRQPQGRARYLADKERERLLTACRESSNPNLYAVAVLAISTGMRKGEILGLTWDRVDLARGWLTLDDTKNRERRGLPIRGLALDVMREMSKVRRLDTSLVFAGSTGNAAQVDKAFRLAREAAGIENFRFHDLRHTAASYLAMNGATAGEIAAVLGHKTLAMVKRYAHHSDAHVAGVVERMNRQVFGE